jgi:hypothetical protein
VPQQRHGSWVGPVEIIKQRHDWSLDRDLGQEPDRTVEQAHAHLVGAQGHARRRLRPEPPGNKHRQRRRALPSGKLANLLEVGVECLGEGLEGQRARAFHATPGQHACAARLG